MNYTYTYNVSRIELVEDANYASENSFQYAFGKYRHWLGLVAYTVDLGIDDVGYMSEHQRLTDHVRSRSQLSGISEQQLHDILLWPQSQAGASPFPEVDTVHDFHMMRKASSTPAERLVAEAVKLVNKQMVRVLCLWADTCGAIEASYGIDSLAAVDLRHWFKVHLGVELNKLDVLHAPSLEALCAKLSSLTANGGYLPVRNC
ncbi:hypothetical protein B0I37DRAFT_353717 [Chaetomium sp. MPI-CAGE-AT-0009]|nr:hypothetical protein B0I37DRAFT_353717 [Chaetomium sp. MPI-CAGE-AT-0009]